VSAAKEYIDRVLDWYEGGELPGEIAAKRLVVDIIALEELLEEYRKTHDTV
jgi:hypothetical protein